MSYAIKELEFRKDSEEEHARRRRIFLDLKSKAINGEKLSEHEKEFFYKGLQLSKLNDGLETEYPCCANPIYKIKYLYYWYDLTGGSIYQKPENGKAVNIPIEEAQKDLRYLIGEAEPWLIEIQKTNHSSELMQRISKETREQIKILNNLPEIKNDFIARGSFSFRYKLWSLLLNSKYMYLMCLEIIETFNEFPFTFKINSKTIEFDEYSLVHIFIRHYAELTKKYETNKSFHNVNFHPRKIAFNLEIIFNKIEGVTPIENINNIIFEYKNQFYEIWIQEHNKSKKGNSNMKILRLDTFYPIQDKDRLEEITQTYISYRIDENLIYHKYTNGNNKPNFDTSSNEMIL